MSGIQESKEVLIGANELSVFLIGILKDGIQLSSDVSAIIAKLSTDSEFRSKLEDAYKGVAAVPAEMKDIDVGEAVELIVLQAGYVPKIIEALKK